MRSRPNILFVHVDQLATRDLSAYDNRFARTPGIDRLIEGGVSFTNSYAANPVCSPARASWFTGRTSSEHGVIANGTPILPSVPDLGQWLSKRGYDCYLSGKWHIDKRDVRESFELLYRGSGYGELTDGEATRAAQTFLRERRSATPFFLSVGLLNPHDCCFSYVDVDAPSKRALAASLERVLPPLPESFRPELMDDGVVAGSRQRGWGELDWRYFIFTFQRLVEAVDQQIARLLGTLEACPFASDTVVIFSSDHGENLGEHNRVSKNSFFDAVSRVPLVVSWPGRFAAGKRDPRLVGSYDVAATICDLAGVEPLPRMTVARSLRPLCDGSGGPWRDALVTESYFGERGVMVRSERHKVVFFANGQTSVYDMESDPAEVDPLGGARAAEVIEKHRGPLDEYQAAIDPVVPLPLPPDATRGDEP